MNSQSLSGQECVVMLIDDQPLTAEMVKRMLVGSGRVVLHYCQDPLKALEEVERIMPTVILLDLVMPEMDGLTLAKLLRSYGDLRRIPIVFLSSREDGDEKAQAFENGASDYLVKLPSPAELLARIRYHSQAYLSRRQRDAAFRALHASQEKLAESNDRLQVLNEELVKASQAKGQFLATMSHEIRTPLNGILGMATLLEKSSLDSRQRSYLSNLRVSGVSLLTLINDILDLSKIEAGKVQLECVPFSPLREIEQVLELVANSASEKGIDLTSVLDMRPWQRVLGDPTRFRQVLINLIANAVKFTSEGRVEVRLLTQPAPDGRVRLSVEVQDTGIGISQEAHERLFQPFSQADSSTTRKYGGTGLGLAISRQLVEMMSGEIQLHSQLGLGSTFSFSCEFERADDLPAEAQHSQPRRLLLIDLSPARAEALRRQLALWNWDLRVGDCPQDAETQFAENPERILVDISAWEAWNSWDGWAKLPADRSLLVAPLGMSAATGEPFLRVLSRPYASQSLMDLFAPCPDTPASELVLAGPRMAGAKILVAEDNAVNQIVVENLLDILGLKADIAGNGLEAVQALQRQSYDLVLMDCEMPEMDGYDATREIRSRLGLNIPIIALTAYAMQGDRERCLACGMNDYLTKPLELEALGPVLERWLSPQTTTGSM